MTPILITIEPFDLRTSARRVVRLGSATEASAYGLGDVTWQPKIAVRPRLSLELFSPDLSGSVQEGECRFSIHTQDLVDENGVRVDVQATKWTGAAVNVYVAQDLIIPDTPTFKGEVRQPNLDADSRVLRLDCAVNSEFLDGPLLTLEFNGDNAAGGEAEARGTLRPAGFGLVENIPPVWFDTTRWIGQIDGYNNTLSIDRLMEGLADRGSPVADYVDYANLAAAVDGGGVPPGQWATCIAEGLVALGAPPEYPITVNATFGSNRLGAIMQRILTVHNDVDVADIDQTSFDALDTELDYPARYWTDSQREIRSLIEAMAGSANATPLVGLDGRIAVTRAVTTPPVATLDRYGSTTPRVTNWRSALPQVPVWRLAARVARPASTIEFSDILYEDDIIFIGLYDPAVTYRQGNAVWLDDGSQWLYINETPAAGFFPPDNPAYWQQLAGVGGIQSDAFPDVPPSTAPEGSYWHDQNNVLYRKEAGDVTINDEAITFDGEAITFDGYVNRQDQELLGLIEELQQIDNDGIISISEKQTVLIPREQEFEAEYQSLTDQATLFGLSLTELDAARSAWLAFRDALTPAWNDTTQATPLPSRNDWDQLIADYATERKEAATILAAGTAVNIAYPTEPTFEFDSSGVLKGGQVPFTMDIAVFRGNTNITTGDGTTYSISPDVNITATIDNTIASPTKGQIEITDVDAASFIDVDVTVDGVTYPTQRILILAKQDTGSTGSFASGANTIEVPLEDGNVWMVQEGRVSVPANGSVNVSFTPNFAVVPNFTASGNPSDTAKEGNCGTVGNATVSQGTINNSSDVAVTTHWRASGRK